MGPFGLGCAVLNGGVGGCIHARCNFFTFLIAPAQKADSHVVLTKGFWLADTACTQELWQA
ncbi:MAG: hypothetical protein JXR76_28630 [Deltaproteobacteria bacterium]|nr:hypothetical protein [Deltaproteobacteria bacterium]